MKQIFETWMKNENSIFPGIPLKSLMLLVDKKRVCTRCHIYGSPSPIKQHYSITIPNINDILYSLPIIVRKNVTMHFPNFKSL